MATPVATTTQNLVHGGAWTYSGDPGSSTKDGVRFEIGDVFSTEPLVSDSEISYALAQEGNVLGAAARIALHLSARFAREGTTRTGQGSWDKRDLSKKYADLAKSLRARSMTAASFLCPSISKSEKLNNELNTDVVQPKFKKGMLENPNSIGTFVLEDNGE